MPHIIVEYTEHLATGIDIPKLLNDLHETLAAQDTVDIHAIKTRAIPVKYVIVGDAHESNRMIHITLRLLPGRDDALKKTMATALHEEAVKVAHHDKRTSISVEVVDMHAASYTK